MKAHKITLQAEQSFTAANGDHVVHGLHLADEWRGLSCYVDGAGQDIILNNGSVVKGAPSLLRALGVVHDEGHIRIPARTLTLPNGVTHHVPEFYVSQRKCSKGDDGQIVIDAARKPWVNIDYHKARKACEEAGGKLLTGLQGIVIALDICEQDINWTGGKVGEGSVYQGLHRGTVSSAQDGNFESSHADERRWHQLSTGERIYDFSGNAWEWIFDDVHGDSNGIVSEIIDSNSPFLTLPPHPSMEKGMGWRPSAGTDWSGYALIRGGYWDVGDSAGVFYLNRASPEGRYGDVGFRSTK